MISRPPTKCLATVGRGDLVHLLRAFPDVPREQIASLLGYAYEPPPESDLPSQQFFRLPEFDLTEPLDEASLHSLPLTARFWYAKEREVLGLHQEDRDVPPPANSELPAITTDEGPPFSPIVPWAGLWPFLKEVLGGEHFSREPDEVKAVARIARGELLGHIPRKARKIWAARAHIVMDIAPRLFPFWGDFNQVVSGVTSSLGELRLKVSRLRGGPFGLDYDPKTFTNSAVDLRHFVAPLLILSDLGAYGEERDKNEWLRFGEALRDQGVRPVVLTPVPMRLWDARHANLFHRVPWDDTGPRPSLHGSHSAEHIASDDDRNVEILLTLCSTAVRVEPRLMRALRRLIPGGDVGTEGKVWTHEAVTPTYLAFSFKHGQHEKFRRDFQNSIEGSLCEAALLRIQEYHSFLSPEVQLEERLAQHLVKPGIVPMDDHLRAFLGWLSRDTAAMGDPDAVRAWLRRMAWRQLPEIANIPETKHLRLKIAEAFGEEIGKGEPVPGCVDENDLAEAAGKALPTVSEWRIVQVGEKLLFRLGPGKEHTSTPTGCELARMRARGYVTVPGVGKVKQQLKDGFELDLPSGGPIVVSSSEMDLTLDIMEKPDWAESISRETKTIPLPSNAVASKEHDERAATTESSLDYADSGIDDVKQHHNILDENLILDEPVEPAGGASSRLMMADGAYLEATRKYEALFATLPLNDSDIIWTFPREVNSHIGSDLIQQKTNTVGEQGRWINMTQLVSIVEDGRLPDLSWAKDHGLDQYGLWAAFEFAGVRQVMRWIRPGTFMMGSLVDEGDRPGEGKRHEVTLTQGYWLADTACTQELWTAVMDKNPSKFTHAQQLPVEQVSWEDCQLFLETLNAQHSGLNLTLPTEAQWEYACRAGTITPFSFGETITTAQVNYYDQNPYGDGTEGEYRGETVPVKALPCNRWGLFQMHGNVWEWCADWYGKYPRKKVVDPMGPKKGKLRVVRGGSWIFYTST